MRQYDYRSLFLQSVASECPDVLRSLAKNVLPIYRSFQDEAHALHWAQDQRSELRKWARAYNLRQEWCVEVALQTLHHWVEHSSSLLFVRWSLPAYVLHQVGFGFSDAGWISGSWSDFEKHIRKRFEAELTKYRLHFKGSDEKRNLRHFNWLALYQCAGLSHRKIADKYAGQTSAAISEDTVSKGIAAAAALIGLTLRPGSRGPKRK
ncbi:MAG: hypothetical protein ACJ74Z_10530 [Bryobacteraceae bacterium]|jgi:hypothetical protein